MDLIQEGNLGLFEAINKFDINLNNSFSTLAYKYIFNSIMKLVLLMQRPYKIPPHKSSQYKLYIKTRNELVDELNRFPTIEEIAIKLNWPYKLVKELYLLDTPVVSLNKVIEIEEEMIYFLLKEDEDVVTNKCLNEELHDFIYKMFDKLNLSEKEKQIMIMKCGLDGCEPKSLSEIAKIFNESKQNINRIEKSIKKRILCSSYIFKLVQFTEEPEKILKELEYDDETIKRKIK